MVGERCRTMNQPYIIAVALHYMILEFVFCFLEFLPGFGVYFCQVTEQGRGGKNHDKTPMI